MIKVLIQRHGATFVERFETLEVELPRGYKLRVRELENDVAVILDRQLASANPDRGSPEVIESECIFSVMK